MVRTSLGSNSFARITFIHEIGHSVKAGKVRVLGKLERGLLQKDTGVIFHQDARLLVDTSLINPNKIKCDVMFQWVGWIEWSDSKNEYKLKAIQCRDYQDVDVNLLEMAEKKKRNFLSRWMTTIERKK